MNLKKYSIEKLLNKYIYFYSKKTKNESFTSIWPLLQILTKWIETILKKEQVTIKKKRIKKMKKQKSIK